MISEGRLQESLRYALRGANRVTGGNLLVDGDGRVLPGGLADVAIDTTGNPEALELALRLARREVDLKSTQAARRSGSGI